MRKRLLRAFALASTFFAASSAHASFLEGEALDTLANYLSWVAIIVAPLIAITLFWIVHVMPEKIAEKKEHPQAQAIHVLCLLSLVFGGLLWPLAWLWAYTKPVMYQMAYGTDRVQHGHGEKEADEAVGVSIEEPLEQQIQALQDRLSELNLRYEEQQDVAGEEA